jgi:hypothetical protein
MREKDTDNIGHFWSSGGESGFLRPLFAFREFICFLWER